LNRGDGDVIVSRSTRTSEERRVATPLLGHFAMALRVCIVGCGALGSVIGAHLARLDDVEVHAYDVSEEHVGAIREHGLQVSGAVEFCVPLHATSEARELPPCEYGVLATKSLHTRVAIEQTAHVFEDAIAVCSVQNGLGNEEIIAERVPHVIRGATTMAAHLRGHGHAGFEFYSELWIGPFEPSGTSYESVEQLAGLMNRSGLRAVPMRDARGAQWTKLIFNSAVNPVGALTRLHHGAATRFGPSAVLYEALLREGESVAKALDISLHGDPRAMIAEGARAAGKRNVSMLLDILEQRPSEVDFINGAIADLGEKLGVPVPLNRAMWQLVKGLEHSWTDPV
jgi:2-dehydropantoate 2-reductase